MRDKLEWTHGRKSAQELSTILDLGTINLVQVHQTSGVFVEIVYPSLTKVRLGSLIYGPSDIGWVS